LTTLAGWTVDWNLSPRLITIPEGTETVTAQDQADTVRKLEDTFRGMSEAHLMDATGKAGGGVTGIVIVLQNAQYAFAARSNILEVGTVTTPDTTGTILTDSAAVFIANGVSRGDVVVNTTSDSHTTVLEVQSETRLITLALVGGSDQRWDASDSYDIFQSNNVQLLAGDLFAVDAVATPIDALLKTFGVGIAIIEQDTSPSAAPGSDATIQLLRRVIAGGRVEIVGSNPATVNVYADDLVTITDSWTISEDLRTRLKVI